MAFKAQNKIYRMGFFLFFVGYSFLTCGGCGGGDVPAASATVQAATLKKLAADRGIRLGGFYDYEVRGVTHDRVFEQEYNAMTAGMFWDDGSRPSRTEFDFSEMDIKVNWGLARGMEVHGHTLVWFDTIPDWVKAAPTTEVESIMNEHIDKVVGRYSGKIKLWDVVNEAVDVNGNLRRDHKWFDAMGSDYISKAFIREGLYSSSQSRPQCCPAIQ